jgi:hypothetical protein
MCSPGSAYNYYNKESLNLYSSIFNSLSEVFRNVSPVPGNKLYFISSDKIISLSFCQLAEMRKIKNTYVSSDYLSDTVISRRSEELRLLLDRQLRPNGTAFPVASFYLQSFYMSRYNTEKVPIMIILILIFAIPFLSISRRNMVMYFSASALAGLEIILLFSLQLIIGNMYQLTGLLIAGLMLGLAVGSAMDIHSSPSKSIKFKCLSLIVFYAVFGIFYNHLLLMKSVAPAILIIISLAFIPAFITGNMFRALTLETKDSATAAVYKADLTGSAFGFLIISAITIPAFGIKVSIFLLSVLTLTGFLFGTISNKE